MPYQRPGICAKASKEAWVYGGHEGSRAVTLSHDAGQRFDSSLWAKMDA